MNAHFLRGKGAMGSAASRMRDERALRGPARAELSGTPCPFAPPTKIREERFFSQQGSSL